MNSAKFLGEISMTNNTRSPRKIRLLLGISLVIITAALVGFGLYSFHAWRSAVASNPATAQQAIIKSVNDLAITPNESPQIATIKDASKLTSGALAHAAKNGDVLLIYNKANRIIVYRPSTHKLVDILSIQPQPQTTTNTPASNAPTNTTPVHK